MWGNGVTGHFNLERFCYAQNRKKINRDPGEGKIWFEVWVLVLVAHAPKHPRPFPGVTGSPRHQVRRLSLSVAHIFCILRVLF